MSCLAGLFDEAWEHRRRRYRSFGIGVLTAAGLAVALVILIRDSGSNAGRTRPASTASTVVAPSFALSKPAAMGVSCPGASSRECDRVGVAVWLKRPAVSVTATIRGVRFPLDNPDDLVDTGTGRAFDGYLQSAGILSRLHVRAENGNLIPFGRGHARARVADQIRVKGHPLVPVQLTIRDHAGQTFTTHLRVLLMAGWG
jgi:hypothetical protein